MENRKMLLILILGLMVCSAKVARAEPMGTAFTYQGFLMDAKGGKPKPADGPYDFMFELYDDPNVIDGNQVGSTIGIDDLEVTNGNFTVELDFGDDPNIFNGEARWLETVVRRGASSDPNDYTILSPRMELTPTPYSLHTRGIFVDDSGNVEVDGGILAKGTYGNGNNLAVGGEGARLIWYPKKAAFRAGYVNSDQWDDANIDNFSVGMGYNNEASGWWATISGGSTNTTTDWYATISGGLSNTITQEYATIGGGRDNTASAVYATISGGRDNVSSGDYASVGGGRVNTAAGDYATVPGGQYNWSKGNYSFTAGYRAKALHDGTFVWADSNDADFESTANDQFLIRASGGVGIGTTSPDEELHIVGSVKIVDGNQSDGKVLTSDANGLASWQTLLPGDSDWMVSGNNMHSIPSGNVGIGTTSPNSELEVAGTVHSTSGGFKFPDGTVQTTASVMSMRVYDSGWFEVFAENNEYVKTHNLGTTKVLITALLSGSADGNDNWICFTPYDSNARKGIFVGKITESQIVVKTGTENLGNPWGSGDLTSGYARIIILALE